MAEEAPLSDRFGAGTVSRRGFIRDVAAASGGVALGSLARPGLVGAAPAVGQQSDVQATMRAHYAVAATPQTVHWGYFSRNLPPLVEVDSGDFVSLETLTHHANDDSERMIQGDPGAEAVFYWDAQRKGVDRRGAGPMDASLSVGCRRGPGRARLHRSDRRQGRGARRRAGGAHPRRHAPPLGQPGVRGQELRQQRGGLVGLPLQRPAGGAQAARGHHDLRDRRDRASATGPGRSTTTAGRRRPTPSG